MTSCRLCGGDLEAAFRFCPWCGHAQRLKLTEFFFGHRAIEGEALDEDEANRVARFLSYSSEMVPAQEPASK
jgi:hypothetical protein